jgi:predicted cupin superfamily sugar epimerase
MLMDQHHRPRTAELLDLAPHPEGGWYRETWRAARPAADTEVLVSCVVAPGFDFADFTLLPR